MENTSGKLVIVPTPIGNMGDITLRAVDILRSCDAVLAEDTRVTGKLLKALDIRKPLIRMDEAAISRDSGRVIEDIRAGKVLAFCSDAGMPGVSDPGMRLVAMAREEGFEVEVLPGPSAAVTAYVASGTECRNFYFGGFLPRKEKALHQMLEGLRNLDSALIFYESPNRIVKSLEGICSVFPERRVCVCRELTKLHEETVAGNAAQVLQIFSERESASPIKGEIAIVIDGPAPAEDGVSDTALLDAKERMLALLGQGVRSKEAAALVSEETGIPKKQAYEMALSLKG